MKRNNSTFAFFIAAAALATTAYARTTLTPSLPSGIKGDIAQVAIHFQSDETIVGARFDLVFDPAVLAPGSIEKGDALADHQVFDEQDTSGKVSLTLLSMTNAGLNAGALVNVSFTLLADVPEGTEVISLPAENTILVAKDGNTKSYEAIQKINELFFGYEADQAAEKLASGRAIAFSARDDGSDASYEWDLGDGTVIKGKEISHTYGIPDSYLVTISASNFLGTTSTTRRLTVDAPYWSIDAKDEGNGWKSFEWFGYYYDTNGPWIYHESLGWLYRVGDTVDDTWLWSEDADWAWTAELAFPYLFQKDKGWLYYMKGSSNPKWFYDYGQGKWEKGQQVAKPTTANP